MKMDAEEKFKVITRNTQEIVGIDELKSVLKKGDLKVYLGTEISGRPHVGYFVPAMKMKDFLNSGCKVTMLLADLHAMLNDMKSTFEQLDSRFKYYSIVIKALLEAAGADVKKLKFVKGSDFQLDPKYTLDMYKLASMSSLHDLNKASSEVVRQSKNQKLGGLIYPIMQALDEVYLDVNAQYGGVDQRKILMFARESLPKIGYKPRIEIMTPMIPGLQGGKMSSSEKASKIDLLDDEATIKNKLNKAFCPEGVIEDNGLLAFMKHVIFVLKADKKQKFVVERPEKWGGNLEYSNYEELENDFAAKRLHPADLKSAMAREINLLTIPIRKAMKGKEKLIKEAYPE
ncbi:tyrosine--tRNA ligase [Candidatus Woesearchaeota archaeon]|nr:tyrosine--tRNA ligase [Candidatus Woesearchaeota archaeon]MBW3022238.1 tyrosine--tRNA ligase [Candidatus Woesearchaeota archaeon]